MRVIILGASGMIGSHLLRAAKGCGCDAIGTCHAHPAEGLIGFDMVAGNVRDIAAGPSPGLRPDDAVFVLSAIVAPDKVLADPEGSRRLNVEATIRCLDEVMAAGARAFFLSSEYIFDGEKDGHTETDSPNPSTLYARQKVEVEDHLQGRDGNWCIVRAGWNAGAGYGARCPVEAHYGMLLGSGARIADDNYFTLSDVEDTCRALLELAARGKTGIYHVAANPPIARAEIARTIIAASRFGDRMKFEAVAFSDISFTEPRPRKAWLKNDKLIGELGLGFAAPARTIAKRVAEIDAAFAGARRVSA